MLFVVLRSFLDARQDAILQYLDCSKAQHAGHQAVGDLLRPPDHDLRRNKPILEVGVGSFDGRTDPEPLLFRGGADPSVSYPHLTLPTIYSVYIVFVVVSS